MESQQQPPPANQLPLDLPPPQSKPSATQSPIPSSTIAPPSIRTPTPNPTQNPSPNPNPNTNPNKTLTPSQQPQSQPSSYPLHQLHSPSAQSRFGRSQLTQHQPSNLTHCTLASSCAATSSVPAALPSLAAPYSPSFGQHQFGGLGRGAASAPESSAGPSTPQVRPQVHGYPNTTSQIRPGSISVHQQPRPAPIRSITNPNNQPTNAQNLSGHGLLRGSSVGSPGLNLPTTLQNSQFRSQPQPWPASSLAKPPLPSHTYRGHLDPQPMQERAHVYQQQSLPGPSQNQQASSSQQQPQFRQSQSVRPGSSLSPQPQIPRGPGHPRPSSFGTAQPFQAGAHNNNSAVDANEFSNSILSKRSIHELVNQVDPSEKLDPEVVDILVDIAEDFMDSITTFGCSLAKHRKSNTLEAKDILLHLERNWNLTIPGFGGDEIRSYRKPVINDIHRERLAAVKKSIGAGTARNLPGQLATKGLARAPGGGMDSQP